MLGRHEAAPGRLHQPRARRTGRDAGGRVIVDPDGPARPAIAARLDAGRGRQDRRMNVEIVQEYSTREHPRPAARADRPALPGLAGRVLGEDRVEGVRVRAQQAGEVRRRPPRRPSHRRDRGHRVRHRAALGGLPRGAVREPPFDSRRNTLNNVSSRIIHPDTGDPLPGAYGGLDQPRALRASSVPTRSAALETVNLLLRTAERRPTARAVGRGRRPHRGATRAPWRRRGLRGLAADRRARARPRRTSRLPAREADAHRGGARRGGLRGLAREKWASPRSLAHDRSSRYGGSGTSDSGSSTPSSASQLGQSV